MRVRAWSPAPLFPHLYRSCYSRPRTTYGHRHRPGHSLLFPVRPASPARSVRPLRRHPDLPQLQEHLRAKAARRSGARPARVSATPVSGSASWPLSSMASFWASRAAPCNPAAGQCVSPFMRMRPGAPPEEALAAFGAMMGILALSMLIGTVIGASLRRLLCQPRGRHPGQNGARPEGGPAQWRAG